MNTKTPSIKAVIFDMDGVLVDSEPFYYDVQTRFMLEQGHQISLEEYSQWVGTASTDMWTSWKQQYHLTHSVEQLMKMNESNYIAYLLKRALTPTEGILDLLDMLDQNGIKKAVASSSLPSIIQTTLKQLGIFQRFDYIISGEEVTQGKPAPDVFLKAAAGLQAPPANCLVIEDARHGVAAAKAAGMTCFGFQNPSSGNQDLRAADYVHAEMAVLSLKIKPLLSGRDEVSVN